MCVKRHLVGVVRTICAIVVHMQRVQIQLTPEQVAALTREASASDRSIAAVIRQALDEWMERSDQAELWERALAVVGTFRSGLGDLAERHDDYLGEDDGL